MSVRETAAFSLSSVLFTLFCSRETSLRLAAFFSSVHSLMIASDESRSAFSAESRQKNCKLGTKREVFGPCTKLMFFVNENDRRLVTPPSSSAILGTFSVSSEFEIKGSAIFLNVRGAPGRDRAASWGIHRMLHSRYNKIIEKYLLLFKIAAVVLKRFYLFYFFLQTTRLFKKKSSPSLSLLYMLY